MTSAHTLKVASSILARCIRGERGEGREVGKMRRNMNKERSKRKGKRRKRSRNKKNKGREGKGLKGWGRRGGCSPSDMVLTRCVRGPGRRERGGGSWYAPPPKPTKSESSLLIHQTQTQKKGNKESNQPTTMAHENLRIAILRVPLASPNSQDCNLEAGGVQNQCFWRPPCSKTKKH